MCEVDQCSACQTRVVSEIKQCYCTALGIWRLTTLECRDHVCMLCLPTLHTNYDPVQVLLHCIRHRSKHLEIVLTTLECRHFNCTLCLPTMRINMTQLTG